MLHIICNGKPVQLPDGIGLQDAANQLQPTLGGATNPAAAARLRHHSQWISDQ